MNATGHREGAARRERGAALLVVLLSVALVTALAMDLAYQARVGLQIAANGRDELVALAQARGAIGLARLVLHFQGQLDAQAAAMAGATGQLPGSGALASTMPRIQVWKLVPVDSALAANLFPRAGDGGPRRDATAGRSRAPGDEVLADRARAEPGVVAGRFSATIDDEDRKVNAQFDALPSSLGSHFESYMALVADRRWDPLFEREDANGVKQSRTELAAGFVDWTDGDSQQAAFTGLPNAPFDKGFGDENYLYDRGPDRYKAKNARFDSLEELFMVAGFSDLHMAAFGDRLTVFLGPNAKMNVNADDVAGLLLNARIMADPPAALQPIFSDPTLPDRLAEAVKLVRVGGLLTMTQTQFAGVLESLGVGVKFACRDKDVDQKCPFTDRSSVFRVRGRGSAGTVVKNIEAVVTFDPGQAREESSDLGRIIHWREE